MSRNDLFLLLACGIVVSVLSGSPGSLTRSPSFAIASLISPAAVDGVTLDPALFQQSLDRQ